ncbi:MAG: hypothetical protein HQL95_04620 [Magnetococcales bacterium]|nr:hypothetical protein [Magnetococcales bacterium]
MSQMSFTIPNQPGASFRAEINASLQALASTNSGPTAPTNPYPNTLWVNTTDNTLYVRNNTNSAWVALCALDQTIHAGVPQNIQITNYTLTMNDAGRHLYHPGSDSAARTCTIPSNAAVAFPVGTVIGFVNDAAAGTLTIAIASDTLVWSPSGGTGNRTLAPCGMASILKIAPTRWMITGTGVS